MKELIKNKFYDATKTLPVVNPTEVLDRRLNIYKWGQDNLYPNYLAALFYNCAIHNGIIRQKVHYTVSGGLNYEGENPALYAEYYKNGNSDFNLDEVAEDLSQDLEIYNAYALAINFVDGKPFQQDALSFEKLRKIYDAADGYDWEYSEDWSDKKEPVKKFKNLDLNERKGQQILVYQEEPKQIKIGKKLTKSVYPAPPYSGGILAIETDIEINNYRRNEVYNNFSMGTIINFNNGQPKTKGDKEEIIDNVRRSGQGTANAGGVMATFNNGKDKETTVTNLTGNNLDSRYLALSKDNKENILLAHSVTNPMLFGIKTEGQLGGATELEVSYNLMKNGYFKYRQRAITTSLQFIFRRLLLGQGRISFNEVGLDLPEEKSQMNTFNFSKESDPIMEAFSLAGKSKENLNILFSQEADLDDLNEEKFLSKYRTFGEVTDMQVNILSLIREGNDFDDIRRLIDIDPANLSKVFRNLETEGLLKEGKVTSNGTRVLAANNKVVLSVVYSYEVRPALNQPEIIPTTRNFCRDLIGLNRVYTRNDINSISSLVDRNVWRYRGGYYHNPKTNKTTPFCRHFWQQNIIIE